MPSVHGYPGDHTFAVFARDVQDSLTPNETQRNTLIVAGCYVLAILILWCVLLRPKRAAGVHITDCAMRLWALQACAVPLDDQ